MSKGYLAKRHHFYESHELEYLILKKNDSITLTCTMEMELIYYTTFPGINQDGSQLALILFHRPLAFCFLFNFFSF